MTKKRLLSLLCALFLLIAVFPFSFFAAERQDSDILFNNEVNLSVNGVSTSYSATSTACSILNFNFTDGTWSSRWDDGSTFIKQESDTTNVELHVSLLDLLPAGHVIDTVTVDYYLDYLDSAGFSQKYNANPDVSFNASNGTIMISQAFAISDFLFIQDLVPNDYGFSLNVIVTTKENSSSGGGGGGTTPTPTNTNVAYVFDELLVYMDGVLEDGWSFGGSATSILVKKADGSYSWKSSDGIISGTYVGTDDLEFSIIPPTSYTSYNFVLDSGTYRYFDTKTTTDKYTVPVSYDSNSNTGIVTWHYVDGTEGHGILTLRFNSVQSDTKTYSITSSSAGFSYNSDTKQPYGTQVVADGQGEFTLYALPYNGKYPRYAEIKNNSGKLLTRVDMTKFDDTAFYCMLPDYGETCIVYIVYSDEVNSDYTNGYNAGYQQGLKDGTNDGSYKEGYDAGYDAGYSDCLNSNSDGWLDFFNGVFGSIFTNIYYVLSSIGFGGVSLLDLISVAVLSLVLFWFAKISIL